MPFSTYLKNLRIENNQTQKEMAGILNVSVNAIKLVENGSTKYPGEKVLNKLCQFKNQTPLDVMNEILFAEENNEIHSSRYFACRYLTYMYLEGWNIDKSPYISPERTLKIHEFDGKISKKGKLKNVVIVTAFERHLVRKTNIENESDALEYIGDLLSYLLSITEHFKDVHLLFDNRSEEHTRIYKIIASHSFSHVDFELHEVLFDPEKAEIIDKVNIVL